MRQLPIVMLFVMMLACTESVDFEAENSDLLIVDGFITDRTGPHSIQLRTAAQFAGLREGGNELAVTGAHVRIKDDLDNCIDLTESSDGIYETPETFQGEHGRSYTLHIDMNDGASYISAPETLTSSGEMGSVYYDLTLDSLPGFSGGLGPEVWINFYTDFTFPNNNFYYLWDWDGTFILETTYTRQRGNLAQSRCDTTLLVDQPIPEFCYVQEKHEGFVRILASNESSMLSRKNFRILSKRVDFNWKVRYSMHLSQYSISERAFEFWSQAERQKNAVGSIFDPTPSQIAGNMKKVGSSEIPVLGYFGAYGMQDWRLFIPGLGIQDSVNACLLPLLSPDELRTIYCCDCRFFPLSDEERPDFWED